MKHKVIHHIINNFDNEALLDTIDLKIISAMSYMGVLKALGNRQKYFFRIANAIESSHDDRWFRLKFKEYKLK